MQATALLQLRNRGALGLQLVQWPGRGREKTERIEMRAAPRLGLHDSRQFVRRKAQRPGVVPHLGWRLPVDHRPLVQTVTGKMWRALRGGAQQ